MPYVRNAAVFASLFLITVCASAQDKVAYVWVKPVAHYEHSSASGTDFHATVPIKPAWGWSVGDEVVVTGELTEPVEVKTLDIREGGVYQGEGTSATVRTLKEMRDVYAIPMLLDGRDATFFQGDLLQIVRLTPTHFSDGIPVRMTSRCPHFIKHQDFRLLFHIKAN